MQHARHAVNFLSSGKRQIFGLNNPSKKVIW